MRPSTTPDGDPVHPKADRHLLDALRLLAAARAAALYLGLDLWEFALGLADLSAAGLSGTDVRCLVARGLAEHVLERLRPASGRRTFRPVANLALTPRSCFAITEAGLRLLAASHAPPRVMAGALRARPRWDAGRRQLWYAGTLVKWYQVPAASQETILAAFEEDGWPPRIDDPLGQLNGYDPHERLHEAVKGLNQGQVQPLLVFRRDGTGEGVAWEGR